MSSHFQFHSRQQQEEYARALRGFAKIPPPQNPRLLWKWVGGSKSHSDFFFKSSQNSPKPVLIFWSAQHTMCTLLKVVGYYDLSVLSMSVMGFKKKVWMDVSSIQVFFLIF